MGQNIPLSIGDRKAIARNICATITAAAAERAGCAAWWEQCERVHYGENASTTVGTDGKELPYEVTHRAFSSYRQDALRDHVVGVITKQRPYMLATSDSSDASDGKAELLHRVWADSHFKRTIRIGCEIATDTDMVFFRFCGLGNGRLEIGHIHPRDMAVFPATFAGVDAATLVGHHSPQPRHYVLTNRASGVFYNDFGTMPTGSGGADVDGMANVAAERSGVDDTGYGGPQSNLSGIINLWDCVVWLDLSNIEGSDQWDGKRLKRYRATVNRDDETLLALEDYTLSSPWYIVSRLIGSPRFYPVRSVGRDLLTLQWEYSGLWSLYRFSVAAAAVPRVYGPTPDQDYDVTRPFEVIDVPNGEDYRAVVGQANVQEIPALAAMCEANGDKIAHVSENTAGGDVNGQTATQTQVVAQAVAVGMEAYIDNFTMEFSRGARITEELIAADYDGFAKRYNIVDADPSEEQGAPQIDPQILAVLAPLLAQMQGGGAPPGANAPVESGAFEAPVAA